MLKHTSLGALLVGALAIGGCESKDTGLAPSGAPASAVKGAETSAVMSDGSASGGATSGGTKFGAPIRSTELTSLASIAQNAGRFAKTTVKTEGKVTAVCQAAGCWMEIADTSCGSEPGSSCSEAHIRMSGHSFFIPKTAAGRRAIVEGTVLAKPDNGECEQEAKEATGKVVKIELDATGVELL